MVRSKLTLVCGWVLGGALLASASFSVRAADTEPNAIAFTVAKNVEPGILVISNAQTIAGIDTASRIAISNGSYSINNGAFTTAVGSVVSGDVVRVRHTASTAFFASTKTNLFLGTPTATYEFKSTTRYADTVPDAFGFNPRNNVALGSVQTSDASTITGLEAAAPISISGGSYSIDGGAFTSVAGTVVNNGVVRVRLTASNSAATVTTATLTIGGVVGRFSVTTVGSVDTQPDPFSFAPSPMAAPGSVQTSEPITVSGINSPASITIVRGTYSINSGEYTSLGGHVVNGDSVRVRQTAATSFLTPTTATLDIGGISADYRVTTAAADTTPDAFSFPPTVNAELGSLQNSAPITVSGIDASAPISITGGLYSIDGQAFTDQPASVENGAVVVVQALAAYSFEMTRTATLFIGVVQADYAVTTISFAADGTPDDFQFAPIANAPPGSLQYSAAVRIGGINVAVPISISPGARYRINNAAFISEPGQLLDGDYVDIELQASNTGAASLTATLSVGDRTADFVVTTTAAPTDLEPDAFSFSPTIDAEPGSTHLSAAIAVSGINAATVVSIVDGRYSINGGPFTSSLGSASNGDSVVVEHVAAADFATATSARLTIGGVSADYSVTTRAADRAPDPFAFAPVIDAVPASVVNSAAVTISGIDAASSLTIVGGRYSINGAAFGNGPGSIVNGDSVMVQVLAANTLATTTTATLTIGGVSAEFFVTTLAADTTPDAFSFSPNPAAFPGLALVSDPVTLTGINAAVTASVSGGMYSVNGGPFMSLPGPVSNGDRLHLLVVPGRRLGDLVTASLAVGGVVADFTATSVAPVDDFPDWFEFREVRGPLNSIALSDAVTVSGINTRTPISIAAGEYQINNSPFASTPSDVGPGDVVRMRAAIGSTYNAYQPVMLTIGGWTRPWAVRSEFAPNRAHTFKLISASIYAGGRVVPGSLQMTEPVIIANLSAPAAIEVTDGLYSINGGAFTAAGGTVVNGDRVVVQFQASSSFSTATSVTLRVGGVSSTLTATTTLDPVASTPDAAQGCTSYVYREDFPVPMRLFVCFPADWQPTDHRPAFINWFGGGFVTGTVSSTSEPRYWAREHGMVGIAPDYRVNDRFGTYTQVAVEDGRAAVKWIIDHAETLGIDPARLVVAGSSAGGGVAQFAARQDAPVTDVQTASLAFRAAAVVTRSGVTDLTDEGHAWAYTSNARFGIYNKLVSPSLHLDEQYPPVLMFHGDHDVTIAATPSIDACSQLIRLGRICEFQNMPGLGHDLTPDVSGYEVLRNRTAEFLTGIGILPAAH